MLQINAEFSAYLKGTGQKGKSLAVQIEKTSKEQFEIYESVNHSSDQRRALWGLWLPEGEHLNPFLRLLGQALWEDRCSNLWDRKEKGYSSIAKPIFDRIIPILNPKKTNKFTEKEGQIIFCNQKGEPLLIAPAVDENMISAFQKGVKELGTLTGHKLLRWQVNTGFEKWQKGDKDPRLIEVEGGYSGIAELAGCKSSHEFSKIREILYAQAYGQFVFPDGSHGNMISLTINEQHRNKEPSKISIVLGAMLLPGYVCQFKRSDRRIIPIGDLPPLHGSPNSHASQAQLQLHVFSEFSNQSIRLAQTGTIIIPIEKWKQMAQESGLNPDKVEAVITHWSQPDLFNRFLDRQGDEYRLASHYERAHRFLEHQGKVRDNNSKNGKRSWEIKKKEGSQKK